MTLKSALFLTFILFSQLMFAINPLREYTMTPADFGLPFEEQKIAVDKLELNAWLMPSSNEYTKGVTIVIAGSDAGNMGFSLPYANQLVRAGYDVVTFDYRGFGASDNFTHNPHYFYHREYITDFTAVVDYTQARFRENKTVVLAFSMGTLIASSGYQHTPYDALIAEGIIYSPTRNVHRINLRSDKHLVLPKHYLLDTGRVQRMDIPMLIFSALDDPSTPYEDAVAIVGMKANRQLVSFGGEHLRGAATLGFAAYFWKIEDFIVSL